MLKEYHNRFDEEHRRICGDCYGNYLDFLQDCLDDERLDALSEGEEYE